MSDESGQRGGTDEQARLRDMVLRLHDVLERLIEHGIRTWDDAPEVQALRVLRNQIAHGSPQPDPPEMARVIASVTEFLQLIERSSLGTPAAHRIRRLSSARDVAAILARTDELDRLPPPPSRLRGSHRLPPPPSTLRGRIVVAAVAAGAFAAAGLKVDGVPVEELADAIGADEKAIVEAGVPVSAVDSIFTTDLRLDGLPAPTGGAEEGAIATLVRTAEPALDVGDRAVPREQPPPGRSLRREDLDPVVAAARTGDPDAIEALLQLIEPIVVRYCHARIGDRELPGLSADDVAEEVCVAVLMMLPDYRDRGGSFLYLVQAIAANKVADAVRSVAPAQPGAKLPYRPSRSSDTDSTVRVWDIGARLGELLTQLPPLHQEVLTLRIVVGLSATETAKALGISPGNVRVTQYRALKRIRSMNRGEEH